MVNNVSMFSSLLGRVCAFSHHPVDACVFRVSGSQSKVVALLCAEGFPLDKKARRFLWKQDPPHDDCVLFHPQDSSGHD